MDLLSRLLRVTGVELGIENRQAIDVQPNHSVTCSVQLLILHHDEYGLFRGKGYSAEGSEARNRAEFFRMYRDDRSSFGLLRCYFLIHDRLRHRRVHCRCDRLTFCSLLPQRVR